jgi:ribosomal protein S18 acetylase RimI-like enzyme
VGEEIPEDDLPPPPFIVKPADTDASEGIHPSSVIDVGGRRLRELVSQIHQQFGQAALIEEFINGRELNVSLFGLEGRLEVLPIAEIDFRAFGKDRPRIVDYAAKWEKGSFAYDNTPRILPAPLPSALADEVRELCRRTWRAMGLQGYARIDFRLDENDRPYVLEANPNPDISRDAGFAAALTAAGIEYHEFVRLAVQGAAGGSYAVPTQKDARASRKEGLADEPILRTTAKADRKPILDLLARTGFFRPDEFAVAREVLDDALTKGPQGHYQSLCSVATNGQVLGWICYGPTPCCIGTYDIYWLAIDPSYQGRGLGKRMMTHAENDIARRGGRMTIVETSSRELYDPTNKFYVACGYDPQGRIPDFYVAGDDKIIYVKGLKGA